MVLGGIELGMWGVLACPVGVLGQGVSGNWEWGPANPGLPGKWPLKWCAHVRFSSDQ